MASLMVGWTKKNYSAKVLLANDERFCTFVDDTVISEWSSAVREWRERMQTINTSQKQPCDFVAGSACGLDTARKRDIFSDEEFFLLTEQLDGIAAALTGPSLAHHTAAAAAAAANNNNNNNNNTDTGAPHSSSVFFDFSALDPAMFFVSLPAEQRARCQVANLAYQEGNYGKAAEIFSSVIDSSLPNMLNAALVCNRAACYMRVENYRLCLRDALRAYEMDDQYMLGICRAVRSYLCLGQCADARRMIEAYMGKKAKCGYAFKKELEEISLYEKYSAMLDRREHAAALRHLNELLKLVPCATFESLKVQLIAVEEDNDEALMYVNDCLKRYADFPELLYWRAQLRFLGCSNKCELEAILPLCTLRSSPADYGARFRQVFQRVQQCIGLCEELDSLFLTKDWIRLVEFCTTTAKLPFLGDKLRAAILTKRAYGLYEMKHFYECMDDVVFALRSAAAGGGRAKLLLLKALCEEKLLRWSDAVNDARLAMKEDRTTETVNAWKRLCERQEEFQRRKQPQRQEEHQRGKGRVPKNGSNSSGNAFYENKTSANVGSERAEERQQKKGENSAKDPRSTAVAQLYAQLSLPCGAGAEVVRKSYRALALQWHPDKWCTASDCERKAAEEKFKAVNAAYEKLMYIVVD